MGFWTNIFNTNSKRFMGAIQDGDRDEVQRLILLLNAQEDKMEVLKKGLALSKKTRRRAVTKDIQEAIEGLSLHTTESLHSDSADKASGVSENAKEVIERLHSDRYFAEVTVSRNGANLEIWRPTLSQAEIREAVKAAKSSLSAQEDNVYQQPSEDKKQDEKTEIDLVCKKCGRKENLSFHRIHLVEVLGSENLGSEWVSGGLLGSSGVSTKHNVRYRLGGVTGANVCRSCFRQICARMAAKYWLIVAVTTGVALAWPFIWESYRGLTIIILAIFGWVFVIWALYGVWILTPSLLFSESARRNVVDLWVKERMRLDGEISEYSGTNNWPPIDRAPKVPLEPQARVGYTDDEMRCLDLDK